MACKTTYVTKSLLSEESKKLKERDEVAEEMNILDAEREKLSERLRGVAKDNKKTISKCRSLLIDAHPPLFLASSHFHCQTFDRKAVQCAQHSVNLLRSARISPRSS